MSTKISAQATSSDVCAREPDDHDRGLQYDLELISRQLQDRRQALVWVLSGGAAALVAACGGGSDGGSSSSSSSATACVADPQTTNGPYPADGTNSVNGSVVDVLTQSGVVRSDIRSSFGSSTTTPSGVPFTLTITLVDTNTGCSPLSGYAIYIWHCNGSGEYSLYSSGVTGENYLRGVQVTESNGQVTFTTIIPGCYSGRYPHVHFEIYPTLAKATAQTNALLTSQMAMPRDVVSTVYASSSTVYSGSTANLSATSTSGDNVFSAFSSTQIAAATPSVSGSVATGYTGTIVIGIAV